MHARPALLIGLLCAASISLAQPPAADHAEEIDPMRFADVLRTRPWIVLYRHGNEFRPEYFTAILLTEAHAERLLEASKKFDQLKEQIESARRAQDQKWVEFHKEMETLMEASFWPKMFGEPVHQNPHRITGVGMDYLAVREGDQDVFYRLSMIRYIVRPLAAKSLDAQ